MCGRYSVFAEDERIEMREIINEINRKYCGTEKLSAMKTGEIFPTNTVPVIAADGPELMTWGFPMQGKSQTVINARSETAFEKPLFSKALGMRRVVIPTTGFYEWSHVNSKAKDKFLFRLPDDDMLYLAGFFSEYSLPAGKETRFTILTTGANDSMRPYHDRMPVYIRRDERKAWIGDGAFVDEAIHRLQPELVATLVVPKRKEPEQISLF